MKKQINPTIKAHLIRSAFYFLLLLGVCAIPFELAQRNATRRVQPVPPEGANPAALSNADLPKGSVPKRPLVPYAYLEKAPYPAFVGLDRAATAGYNDLLYVIGGESYNGSSYAATNVVERFDPVANSWTAMAS